MFLIIINPMHFIFNYDYVLHNPINILKLH